MGILKGIIDRFRAMGKTENEILSIVEAAADKATVNPDVAKNENPQKPEIKIETTAEAFVEAVLQTGTTLQQAKTAILTGTSTEKYFVRLQSKTKRTSFLTRSQNSSIPTRICQSGSRFTTTTTRLTVC